jgi:8-amino-7-oxononanoate synthase
MDLFDKCRDYTIARDAMAAGIYPYFIALDANEGPTVRYRGREVVMCGSNNYLGLTTDERVLAASRAALDVYGPSCTGSRFLNGNIRLHEELEHELAAYFGKPAALVFSTGYQANVGTISALLSKDDVIFTDADVHASLIDGCRLSRSKVRRFAHNDPTDLARQLATYPSAAGKLVVVDGVYSMEGDICTLPDIVRVCREFDARLLVDDAHGAGVLADGRGTCAHFGSTDDADLITITFSKSFASLGGAVLGSEESIHYIRHHARSLIFSASIAPPNAAAALAAVRIVAAEPWRSRQALANAVHIRRELTELGFDTGASQTPIVPVYSDDVLPMLMLWRRLLEAGVYTNAVLPPAASARLRTSYMATHDADHLDRVVEAFAAARDDVEFASIDLTRAASA